MSEQHPMSRRCALGMLALGTSAPVLTACGSGEGNGAASSTPTASAGSGGPPSSASPSAAGDGSSLPGAGREPLVPVSEVPVGGGVVLAGAEVVVTQPSEGEFRGFSAICPHAQVVLSDASAEEQIFCGNGHGSRFTLEDGSVINGPATSPLTPVEVRVEGDQVVRA